VIVTLWDLVTIGVTEGLASVVAIADLLTELVTLVLMDSGDQVGEGVEDVIVMLKTQWNVSR